LFQCKKALICQPVKSIVLEQESKSAQFDHPVRILSSIIIEPGNLNKLFQSLVIDFTIGASLHYVTKRRNI